MDKIIVVTTNYIPGMKITEVKGHAFGLIVRSRNIGSTIVAKLRSLAGGEIVEYTNMLAKSREEAIQRLEESAIAIKANAVIGLSFDSSEMGETMTEIIAYGTAVVVEKETAKVDPVSLR